MSSTRRSHQPHQPAAMHRPGAAERAQREVGRRQPALDRHDLQRADHVVVDDLDNAARSVFQRYAERRRYVPQDRRLSLGAMQRDLAVEQMRRHAAEHEVRIRHRRAAPALAIGRRARIGAGAFRPDRQRAFRPHRRDRAAARADGVNVDNWQSQRKLADAARRRRDRLAIADQRHVRTGATHIDRDEVVISGDAPYVSRATRTCRRS